MFTHCRQAKEVLRDYFNPLTTIPVSLKLVASVGLAGCCLN